MSDEDRDQPTIFHSLQLRRQHLHEQIADSIQDLIGAEQLLPGTQLPSERELAKLLGVNRATVREAIRVLEQRGLVTMRMGSGTYVADLSLAKVAESIERYLAFGGCTHEDLIKLREILDPEIAGLAAERATDENLAELKALVDTIETAFGADDIPGHALADTSFHEALGRATQNQLIRAISAGLRNVMQGWMLAQSSTHRLEGGAHSHRLVYEAIAARDPEAARRQMKFHNSFMRQTLTQDVELAGMRLGEILQLKHKPHPR